MRIKNSFTGVLFLAFMINVNFSCNICAAAPLLQGDFILSENYTLDADYGQLTGSLTIDGQENSFDGNGFKGFTTPNVSGDTFKIIIKNLGKYTLTEIANKTENSITKLQNGNRVYFSIQESDEANGVHNFFATKGNAVFANSKHGLSIQNSVVKNNKIAVEAWGAINGGIISNVNTDNGLIISDSYITKNTVQKDKGTGVINGAIYNSSKNGSFVINNSIVTNNESISNYIPTKSADIPKNAGSIVYGGAVYSDSQVLDINNSYFANNSAKNIIYSANGGAIYAKGATGTIANIANSVFENNSAVSAGYSASGGAIYLGTNASVFDSLFLNNTASSLIPPETANISYAASGGAITLGSSAKNVYIANTEFTGNSAVFGESANGGTAGGGAIYTNSSASSDTTLTVVDSSFKDNIAYGSPGSGKIAMGGAIHNSLGNKLNVVAKDKDVVFSGNKSGKNAASLVSNAIHDRNGGTINLNAAADKKIVFDDSITSENDKTKLNINSDIEYIKPELPDNTRDANTPVSAPKDGTIVLNNDMTGYNGSVNLDGGTLVVGENGTFFNNATSFTVNNPSNLDVANGVVQNHNFNNFNLKADLNTSIDADIVNKTVDNFSASSVTVENDAKINIDKINVIDNAQSKYAEIKLSDVSDNSDIQSLITVGDNVKTAMGKIYKYDVDFDDKTGEFKFTKVGESSNPGGDSYNVYTPSVYAAAVAMQIAAQAGMKEVSGYAFEHADGFTMLPKNERLAKINADVYAISEYNNQLPLSLNQTEGNAFWLRPFSTIEKVNLAHGPKVDNVTYGSLIGIDGKFKKAKRGWTKLTSGYIGYHGSLLDYSDIDINSNSMLLGITKNYYKNNFWAALSTMAGAGVGKIDEDAIGSDDFVSMNMGVSSRMGYNFEFKEGGIIFQPIASASYYFTKVFDYTNARGVKINSDPLSSLELKPGIRLIGNTKNGWQPYLSAAMVWNLFNQTDLRADGIKLPDMYIKPYVEYGLGIQRGMTHDFTCYLQSLVRTGGRNGVAFTGGLHWAIGKLKHRKDNL